MFRSLSKNIMSFIKVKQILEVKLAFISELNDDLVQ